ncbi:hypothetical protein ACOMHN_034373 [Nucella lapillus]
MERTLKLSDPEVAMELLVTPTLTDKEKKDAFSSIVDNDKNENDDDDDDDDDDLPPSSLCFVYRGIYRFRRLIGQNSWILKRVFYVLLFLAYMCYFAYCMYYRFGDEPSLRLLVVTIIGICWLVKAFFKRSGLTKTLMQFYPRDKKRLRLVKKIVRWCLYVASVGGMVAILSVDVFQKRPQNMICLGGIAILILFSCFVSRKPEKINWHSVFWGIGLQFWLAVLIMKTQFGKYAFQWLSERTVEFLKFTDEGSEFAFGPTFREHRFTFQLMPMVMFFNAILSVLYYLGVIQVIFAEFGRVLSFCIGTSPVESVSAAANIVLSLVETPLLVKPFVKDMTKSELFAIMTAGYASVSGSLLWLLAAYGAPINHILTASVMSAPAALAFAKLIYPDERKSKIQAAQVYKIDTGHYGNMLSALSGGAKDGIKMAALVVVNVLVYIATLRLVDSAVLWFSQRAGVHLTMIKLMSYPLSPFAYLMGFEAEDCLKAAGLLGVKIVTSALVSFFEMGKFIKNGKALQEYITTTNGTWSYVGDDIFLHNANTTLLGGIFTERSTVLSTYMMCGLSSLVSIGITVGAYSALVPSRVPDIVRLAPLACVAGNLACFSTACVAGLLYID